MAVEIPEGAIGPRMRALRTDKQRAFCWIMATGVENAAGAARLAGYADNGSLQNNARSAVRVTAHHLMQDPDILDAIEECTRATLRGLAPVAVDRAHAILKDPKHPYHGRMIETVLDRTGFFAKSEHTMKVEHSVDVRELEALARRLAKENGISAEKLLGNAKTIDGEAVDE
jgi:phage terminase small subunit